MTGQKEALKPCPFCGGCAEYYKRKNKGAAADWCGDVQHWVGCTGDCGASTCHHETKAEAIAAWNTRADEAELATLRAKLAERDALLRKRHDCLLQFVTPLAHAPRKPCTWMQIREAASDLLTQIDALTGGDE